MNLEKYVLGSELAEKGNFHIANISMLINEEWMQEGIDYKKFGGITLLHTECLVLPAYIQKVIDEQELSDLSGLVPKSFVKSELSEYFEDEDKVVYNSAGLEDVQPVITKNYINKIKGMFEDVMVSKKSFVKISDDKLALAFADRKNRAIMDVDDFPEANEYVDGYIELTNDKVLAWF